MFSLIARKCGEGCKIYGLNYYLFIQGRFLLFVIEYIGFKLANGIVGYYYDSRWSKKRIVLRNSVRGYSELNFIRWGEKIVHLGRENCTSTPLPSQSLF